MPDASAFRTRGATCVPSSSLARISFACGNAATLIWNVIREMPPNDSFTRRIFFRDGFRIADQKRYKSAALNQLSYAGKNTAHINGRCRAKQVADSDAELTRRYLKRVRTTLPY